MSVKYPLSEKQIADNKQRYTHHAPFEDQAERYGEIRAKIEEVANFIEERVPQGRELSEAKTMLDGAMFAANSAIARGEKKSPQQS